MLHQSDGLFRDIGSAIAEEYSDVEFETFIVDDFLCRMITQPDALDVVVTPTSMATSCQMVLGPDRRFGSRSFGVLWSRLRLLRIRPWYRPRYPRYECHQPNRNAALRKHDARVSWA